MGKEQDQAAWRAAEDFEGLLALTRDFLEGRRGFFPGWGSGDTDEESDALLPALRGALKGGLLTVASQPGAPFGPGHDGWIWGGRAFAGGLMETTEAAERVAARAEEGGLFARLERPGEDAPWSPVPVGLRDGVPYLLLGPGARAQELEIFEEHVSPPAAECLRRAPLLWIIDPVWGRRGRLPDVLGSL